MAPNTRALAGGIAAAALTFSAAGTAVATPAQEEPATTAQTQTTTAPQGTDAQAGEAEQNEQVREALIEALVQDTGKDRAEVTAAVDAGTQAVAELGDEADETTRAETFVVTVATELDVSQEQVVESMQTAADGVDGNADEGTPDDGAETPADVTVIPLPGIGELHLDEALDLGSLGVLAGASGDQAAGEPTDETADEMAGLGMLGSLDLLEPQVDEG